MTNATMLADRAVLRLSGEDVRGFLQGLVTNDVTGPLPVWTALLTPQGKALFDFLVWGDGEALLLDCEAEQADALAKRLTLYRLRRKIAIARDDSLAVHWAVDGSEGVPDPRLAALGQRWIAAPGEAAAIPAGVSLEHFDRLRLRMRVSSEGWGAVRFETDRRARRR
jgi:folate-binding Fe-S cluster repair protein YgfZ